MLEKILIGKYDKSVVLTYLGACSAVTGCALTLYGLYTGAIICLILSGVCDLFDGKVARMCKRDEIGKAFGVQIDSLADVVAFLVLPSLFGYVTMQGTVPRYCGVVYILFVLTGLIRLAWFNLHATTDRPVAYYTGLPVTSSAIVLPLLYLVGFFIPNALTQVLTPIVFLLMGVLFVARFRIPKMGGKWYAVCGIAAIVLIGVFIALGILYRR